MKNVWINCAQETLYELNNFFITSLIYTNWFYIHSSKNASTECFVAFIRNGFTDHVFMKLRANNDAF